MTSKKILIILLSVFISGFFLGYFSAQDEKFIHLSKNNYENVLVTGITDGDTIVIESGNRVRLLGINTPEKGKDYYKEAKNYLEDRILMKEVRLEASIEDKDQYSRLLRYVWLNDSLINLEQIEKGYASAYFYNEQEKYKDLIAEAEKKAMNNKLGLWKNI